jgi:multiple sugar transport system substrate-binding protein
MAGIIFLLGLPLFGGGQNEKSVADEKVTIQYWQYVYDSKVKLMDELIGEFQAQNPNITVEHITYPYDSFFQKMTASIVTAQSSGVGPNIINFNSGTHLGGYQKQGILQPLDTKIFNPDVIDKEYSSLVQLGKYDGAYYTLPVAVRTYALFYNKTLLKEAGLTEADIPATWEGFADLAQKLTKWENGELKTAGVTMDFMSRLPHWYYILVKGLGKTYISEDRKTAQYNSPEALKALNYLVDLYKNRKVAVTGFKTIDHTAFASGSAAFHVDGSFRAATFVTQIKDAFEWGVTTLPKWSTGNPATVGDYWCNAITTFTKGAQKDASLKFLQFLSSEEVMKRWTLATGEIGARVSIVSDPELNADPILSPFLKGLPYAFSNFSVDRYNQDDGARELFENCLTGNADPKATADMVNKKLQTALDEFWAD